LFYNTSLKGINKTINAKRKEELVKIEIEYIADMVKLLQNSQDFIFAN